MPQKPYLTKIAAGVATSTTSFIVSSDESLNRRPLSSSGRSSDDSSSSSGGDNMAVTAAASDLIQNNHHHHNHHPHQAYFVTTAASATAHSLAFNQSSESSVSSSSQYSSSSGTTANPANCQVVTPTKQQQQMNVTQQRFGSAPNQLSVNSLNEQYGNHFTDMQRQSADEYSSPSNHNDRSGLLNPLSQGQQQKYPTYANNNNQKSNLVISSSSFQQQQQQQHSPNQRSSLNSLDSSASNSLMPINVKGMLLNGCASEEVLRSWLISIKCDEYLGNFLDHGYDMHLLTKMTPQDLTAIGCKSPNLRKKLLLEIKKLNLEDEQSNSIDHRPTDLAQWLSQLKLGEYYGQLCREGYDNVEKVCQLTWEDLEEIGIAKLGHQKQLLLGIERIQKLDKQTDNAIYDVHPNHRISLHPGMMSDKRHSRSTVRSGFFNTKSGNLDRNRGVPVAPVMPSIKHVTNSLANMDLSNQQQQTTTTNVECLNGNNQKIYSIDNDSKQRISPQSNWSGSQPSQQQDQQGNEHNQHQQTMKMSDFTGTMKRPPPLPPVRTNSLKINLEQMDAPNSNNAIYDNTYGAYPVQQQQQQHSNGTTPATTGYNTMTSTTSSTSFLRTPKLGTLTATTNKMLSHGGHIQTISSHAPVMPKSIPIREAPHPPQVPPPPPPPGSQAIQAGHQISTIDPLVDSSLIGHQIASADEFPPPPPPPQ